MKQPVYVEVRLDKIVGGGQALGTLEDGRKLFAWGGLPGELVKVRCTKKKSSFAEGIVTEVLEPSKERVVPRDEVGYLSTSPWQIMDFDAEQRYKAQLITEAFTLHHISLPGTVTVFSDAQQYEYRNKVEYSFWWDTDKETLDLAFFMRGGKGKLPVPGTSLAMPAINEAAQRLLAVLRARGSSAFQLKTALIRSNQHGEVVLQLYVKENDYPLFSERELAMLDVSGFELIYSDHRSPASVITKRLQRSGAETLSDTILGIPFTYAAESFFQVNLPVYEQALKDMSEWTKDVVSVVELYSGVGSIGLTTTSGPLIMIEINEPAIREAERTIKSLGRENSAKAIFSPSEKALEYITSDATIIVDPPRAGLHADVITKLLSEKPPRIIYLSCNPVTQARDTALLADAYTIRTHKGYNFFPRTPHIEHLVVYDRKE